MKGAFLMVLSCGVITVADLLGKIVLSRVPVGEVMLVRGTFLFLIILAAIGPRRRAAVIVRRNSIGSQLLCGTFQVLSAWCFFSSLPLLPFSVAVAISFTNPLFVVVLSRWVLSEKVGVETAIAVTVGFVGVVLVAQPHVASFSWAALLPVGSGLFGALRDMWMRRLTRSDSSVSILLFSQLLLTASGLPATFAQGIALGRNDIGMLALMAVALGLATFWAIEAFRHGQASFVAPFRYSGLIWAPLLAFATWRELPSAVQVIGMLLIASGGIFALFNRAAGHGRAG